MLNEPDLRLRLQPESPGYDSVPITPSDSTVLTPPLRSLYVTGAGDVSFVTLNGTTDTWTVPANFVIPVVMVRVRLTGTTATGLKGIR